MPTTPSKPGHSHTPQISTSVRKLFLDQLDAHAQPCEGAERRRSERHRHRCDAGIVIAFDAGDGPDQEFLVHPRNISESGIGLLHEAYVYPETRCRVLLPATPDEIVEVSGTVVDCRHVHARLHEIGVHFDYPVDLDEISISPGQ